MIPELEAMPTSIFLNDDDYDAVLVVVSNNLLVTLVTQRIVVDRPL